MFSYNSMKRIAYAQLSAWKSDFGRKPLLIKGARQVGKSYLIKLFGKENYTDIIEINFEKQPKYHQLFAQDLDAKRIANDIEATFHTKLSEGNVLLFLDEIQECPNALKALRYFYEDTPNIPLIAAGSLLDFQFRNISYPVGRIQTMDMYPMTFVEFLTAMDMDSLATLIQDPLSDISPFIEQKIYDQLYLYFWIGGMPACIAAYKEHQNLNKVRQIQNDLLFTFRQDFNKYEPKVNPDCLNDVLTSGINKIGQQIIYTKLSDRFTGPTIKKGVEVLCTARILTKIENVSLSGLPFAVSGKQFKLNYLDIGLLIASKGLATADSFSNNQLINTFYGMMAEQFVGQQLKTTVHNLYYWDRTNPGSNAEIDYVISRDHHIIPIEVKSGKSGTLKSLHLVLSEYPGIEKAIIYSQAKSGSEGKLHWLPIYRAGEAF